MSVARGAALVALTAGLGAGVLSAALPLGGRPRVHAALPDRRPARQGRRRAGRRPPCRLGARDRADRRQPGRDQGRGAGALRAAARGHAGRHPPHVAVGHRQPLRRADAGARHQPPARRGRHADHHLEHVGRGSRPALQHAGQQDARRPPERRPRLRQAVRGQGRGGRAVGQVLQPAALDLAPVRRGAHRGREHADALPRQLLARHDDDRRAARRPRRARRQRQRDGRRDRRRERGARARARPAAHDAAARQHDLREPAGDARRPRRARRASPSPPPAGSRRCCASCGRWWPTRARRSATCAAWSAARGPDNDLVEATRKLPALQRAATPAFASARGALQRSQPVLEFVRPYAPDLVGWFRDFGQGAVELRRQRPLRAHPADLQRLQLHRQPGRRDAAADPAVAALRRAGDRRGPALPGRGEPAGARTDSSPYTDNGNLSAEDCDPRLVLPGP